MTSGQILIVSDDTEFVRALSACWRTQKDSPAITAVSTHVSGQANPAGYVLVVVGPLRQGGEFGTALPLRLESTVCAVGDPASLASIRIKQPDWLPLPEYPGWAEALLCIAREVLRRNSAEGRTREAEMTCRANQHLSVLGRFLLEARPGMVNPVTSLLGNADLILLSEEPLAKECREQVRTIRTMALRLNEIVQRLSSIESELELSDRKSHLETREIRMAEASNT